MGIHGLSHGPPSVMEPLDHLSRRSTDITCDDLQDVLDSLAGALDDLAGGFGSISFGGGRRREIDPTEGVQPGVNCDVRPQQPQPQPNPQPNPPGPNTPTNANEEWKVGIALPQMNCNGASMIRTKEQCINAAEKMGIVYIGEVESAGRPAGCFWDPKERLYFNQILDVNVATAKFGKAVCGMPANANEEWIFGFAQSQMNCNEASMIRTELECKLAAKSMDLEFDHEVEDSSRPAGCFRDPQEGLYFNQILDADVAKTGWGKGVCSTPSKKSVESNANGNGASRIAANGNDASSVAPNLKSSVVAVGVWSALIATLFS